MTDDDFSFRSEDNSCSTKKRKLTTKNRLWQSESEDCSSDHRRLKKNDFRRSTLGRKDSKNKGIICSSLAFPQRSLSFPFLQRVYLAM